MAYHSFLVEPISCHAWNKDRTRECPRSEGGGAGALRPVALGTGCPPLRLRSWCKSGWRWSSQGGGDGTALHLLQVPLGLPGWG